MEFLDFLTSLLQPGCLGFVFVIIIGASGEFSDRLVVDASCLEAATAADFLHLLKHMFTACVLLACLLDCLLSCLLGANGA